MALEDYIEALKIAAKSAVLATLCCSTPVLLIPVFLLLGAGSVTAALSIPRYKWVFYVLGALFLALSLRNAVKRRKGVCSRRTVRESIAFVSLAVVSYVLLALLLLYVVLPRLAEFAYGLP